MMPYLSLPRAFEKTTAINSSISGVEQKTLQNFFFSFSWLSDIENNTDKVWTINPGTFS